MTWLVTGGAGFIGSHVVDSLERAGIPTVALDNLSTGTTEFLSTPFIRADVLDTDTLIKVIVKNDIEGVIHLAGYKWAGESTKHPSVCYEQNVLGTISVLDAMVATGIKNLVFSSSAAVYKPYDKVLTEYAPKQPITPYGRSKWMGEQIIEDYALAHGIQHTCLRYMNVIGASEVSYDRSPYNLLPKVIGALNRGEMPEIFGTNYPTIDGTCVRDYVDVRDIARAHLLAVQNLDRIGTEYNLGTSTGFSVRDVMSTLRKVAIDFTPVESPRRPGDVPIIVCSNAAAYESLGWQPEYALEDSVRDAWLVHTSKM